jgi:hypothetical protein
MVRVKIDYATAKEGTDAKTDDRTLLGSRVYFVLGISIVNIFVNI